MKLTIFGLTISSSWGNGHASIWRSLCKALHRRGHTIVFFEKDVPYYAQNRDASAIPGVDLRFYKTWEEILPQARINLADADVGMVTSYCPDALKASELVLSSPAWLRVFYDMDAPVTLEALKNGKKVPYICARGFRDFDLVLSFAGGETLMELKKRLGAHQAAPLYGCVDPEIHGRVESREPYRADLSYLGTYAPDRERALENFFIEPSRKLPRRRFVAGGSLYPESFSWNANISYVSHVPVNEHPAFYSSSALTLNVTRGAMSAMGYCPSGRLFEAASCATPVISDWWPGLDHFFEPGGEITIVRTPQDVVDAIGMDDAEKMKIGRAARERVMEEHTAEKRVLEMEYIFNDTLRCMRWRE